MPVQKVDFKIENVYDTANNISERLFLIFGQMVVFHQMKLLNLLLRLLLTYLHY
jgi:hypothetical protein